LIFPSTFLWSTGLLLLHLSVLCWRLLELLCHERLMHNTAGWLACS
jgi:hypothetical protein